jgi:hypothetical protein
MESLLLGVWTPDSLIVVGDIIGILVALIVQVNYNFLFSMRERTEIPVFAGVCVPAEGLAEFAFVPTGVVQLLDFVVGFGAIAVLPRAGDVVVLLKIGPSSVLLVVVVEADLAFVWF